MVRGNRHAHRNGTHHQHPPDHARRRQHPTSSQRQSVRSHHHQHRKQGNPRKQTAGETLHARLANQTSNQTDGEPATQNPDEYNRQLVIPPSDVMATINYPKLGISLPIRHGTSEQTLAIGAGHWEGTSLPIGGAGTHTVITAHRGLADKLMFTKLDQAREGDEFTITTLGENPHLSSANNPHHHPRRFHLDKQTRRQRRSGHPYDLHPIRHQHPPASHHRNARPQPRRMPARNRMPHRRNPLHHGIRAHSHLGDPHHTRTA